VPAGVAFDMSVTIVEQLEVIDVDHQQSDRAPMPDRLPPGPRQGFIEVAAVGQAGQRIDQCELLEMLVGGPQLTLAFGQLLRHLAQRRCERRELLGPALPLGTRSQVAASEPRGGARQ
jgi:hypothetical protein